MIARKLSVILFTLILHIVSSAQAGPLLSCVSDGGLWDTVGGKLETTYLPLYPDNPNSAQAFAYRFVIRTGPQGSIESLWLEANRGVILVSGAKIELINGGYGPRFGLQQSRTSMARASYKFQELVPPVKLEYGNCWNQKFLFNSSTLRGNLKCPATLPDGRQNLIEFLFALEPLTATNPSNNFQSMNPLNLTSWKGVVRISGPLAFTELNKPRDFAIRCVQL